MMLCLVVWGVSWIWGCLEVVVGGVPGAGGVVPGGTCR